MDHSLCFSQMSLLVYSNATDFYMLILYPTTWLSSLIRANTSLVESLWFSISIYKIISSANRDNFTFSFPILISFIYFSCPLSRTSSTVLIRVVSGHPCLFLRGKAINLLPLSTMCIHFKKFKYTQTKMISKCISVWLY